MLAELLAENADRAIVAPYADTVGLFVPTRQTSVWVVGGLLLAGGFAMAAQILNWAFGT
jgi:uncharacterized membrane protein